MLTAVFISRLLQCLLFAINKHCMQTIQNFLLQQKNTPRPWNETVTCAYLYMCKLGLSSHRFSALCVFKLWASVLVGATTFGTNLYPGVCCNHSN